MLLSLVCLLSGSFLYFIHAILQVHDSQSAQPQKDLFSVLQAPVSSRSTISTLYSFIADDGHIVGLKGLPDFNCVLALEGVSISDKNPFPEVRVSEQTFIERTVDCQTFRRRYGYLRYQSVTKEELQFPLAFNILLYKDVDQLHVLLRAIYRPNNAYCLHVDGHAKPEVFAATLGIAACVPGVFLVSKRENVTYSGFTRLQADINCMQDHWQRSLNDTVVWRYLINLASQNFPLKTNQEIVRILSIYNGSNDIEGITGQRIIEQRFMYKHVYLPDGSGRLQIVRTDQKHTEPPHNISVVKGSAYGVFSRGFVDYVLHDQRAKDLLSWSRHVDSPDEYFWATLNHNPHLQVPGGYAGPPDKKPWLAVYAAWPPRDLCASAKHVRGVCIFGVADLPQLVGRRELFANKFYLDFDPQTLHCLDMWIFNKSWAALPLDTFYYRQLSFVPKH